MFAKTLIAFSAVASLVVPTLAVPRAAWIRRQEDAQKSLTLDPAVISPGLAQDGQGDNPDPGQVRSLTTTNNFINFCLPFLDQGVPLTDGKQIATGSCNPTPIGRIISLDLAPRCKFVFPKNGDDSLIANQPFTVQLKIKNMQTGFFVNAQTNYYGAPQQVNDQGIVKGHSHVVIELLPSIDSTEPLDPLQFKFFKGLNDVAQNDILTASVSSGLAAGAYRLCSINTGANHQPTLVSNAQHGTLDDCVYFTIKEAGDNKNESKTESATKTDSATATNADKNTATESATASNDNKNESSDSVSATETDSESATETDSESATETSSTEATATEGAGNNDQAPESTEASATETEQPAETQAPNQGDQQQEQPQDQNNNGDNNSNNGDNNANNGGKNDDSNNGGNDGGNNDVNTGAGDNQNADNGNNQNSDNGNGQNVDNGNNQNTDNGNNQNADNGNNQNADNGNNQNADSGNNPNADNGNNGDNNNGDQNAGGNDNGAADNNDGAADNGADAQQN